jgi:UDP-N-acetylmuramoyl-L-alanyl-D-glutamate--2,6-diaminopimelate ligase
VPELPRPSTVRPRPVAELADLVGAAAHASVTPPPAVTGITHASDAVRPGDLFAALPGVRTHGARFAGAAAEAGAVAVLTDAAGAPAAAAAGLPALVVADPRGALGPIAALVYDEPTEKLDVIGVTGTAGKTSTDYLIVAGLQAAGRVAGLIGTVETRLGDLVVESDRTTPEASDLQALFAVAVERGVQAVAMEVSSHALALGRVNGTSFAVGGYTNFGTDHLDFHASREDYFAAKALLFDGRCRAEVLNLDDPALRPLMHPKTITYSAAGNTEATWWASDVRPQEYGQRFVAHGPDGVAVAAAIDIPGRHNVANALLAMASLAAVGVDPAIAAAGIAACPGVPGRLERVDAPGPVIGVVDYAHKPEAIDAVLAALHELTAGRVICVLGAGGDRDSVKRPLMGAAAARGADLVMVTDDNPRTEDPARVRTAVRDGAVAAGVAGVQVVEIGDRREAIHEAVRRARPGDVVALLGKGHERGQEVGGHTYPFDDRVELAAALTARFGADS